MKKHLGEDKVAEMLEDSTGQGKKTGNGKREDIHEGTYAQYVWHRREGTRDYDREESCRGKHL